LVTRWSALIALVSFFAPGIPSAAASPSPADELRRPLHLPKLKPGQKCPVSPSRVWAPTTRQRLNGRGPVFLVSLDNATVRMNFSFPDGRGWYAQKTPWVISRQYDGPLLVRGARLDRRGGVRFARGYGEHLRELYWDAGADQSLWGAKTLITQPKMADLQARRNSRHPHVYVQPNGLLGTGYMAAIRPFRHLIVYPQMLRHIGRAWRAAPGDHP
jgi:hypothetical protein